MKNILVVLIFTFMVGLVFSQEIEKKTFAELEKEILLKKKNTISVSPFQLIFSEIMFSYERKFKDLNSIVILGSFANKNFKSDDGGYLAAFGELHYRRYIFVTPLTLKKESLNSFGIFTGAFGGYGYVHETFVKYHFDYNTNTRTLVNGSLFHNEVKFGLTPRKQVSLLGSLPFFRNVFSTCCYYLLKMQ